MDAAAWRRLAPLVDEVLDLAEERRAAYVAALGERDPALGRDLAAFLAAEAASRGFLELPVEERATALLGALAEDSRSWDALQMEGARVGPYRVRRELGRGGMGVVLLAERVDGGFEQQVALKLVRRGVHGPRAFARFAAERQILARLEHPHVARLLDGGMSASGQPYFAMEYVEGVPLLGSCDARRLGLAARLRLFLQVCDAVEHAHRNLVVHRDLKPSNILVTEGGEAKLLDFGIARVLEDGLDTAGNPTLTGAEGRALTPQYAAPEQLRGQPVTTATDVYSLGVVLHELLCGRPPYRLDGLSFAQIERTVAEKEPVACSAGAIPEDVAAARQRTAAQLARDLRGDLDTVVAVALRKDPARRYTSVSALGDDVRRYLEGRPVLARGDRWTYRVAKFVRRHRAGVAAAALLLITAVAGVVSTVRQANEARRQAEEARRQAARAEEVKNFTLHVFEMSDPDAAHGRVITARELLDNGARRVEKELFGQTDLQAEMWLYLGNIYHLLGLDKEALPLNEKALALRLRAPQGDPLALAEAERAVGYSHLSLEDAAHAEEHLDRAVQTRRQKLGAEHPATAIAEGQLGQVRSLKGDDASAEPLLRHAVEVLRRETRGSKELGSNLSALGLVLQGRGDLAGAEAFHRESLALRRTLLGEDHSEVAGSLHNLAAVMKDRGDLAGAEAQYREALAVKRRIMGPNHEGVAGDLISLGATLLARGRYDEAEALLREALALQQRVDGLDSPRLALALHSLARILRHEGRLAEAEPLSRRALAYVVATLGDGHARAAAVRDELAQILLARGRLGEAEAVARRALDVFQRQTGGDPAAVASSSLTLGQVLVAAGRPAEAEGLLREAVRRREQAQGRDDWRAAEAHLRLGQCLAAQGRPADAQPELASARMTLAARLGPDHPLAAEAAAALEARDAPVSAGRRAPRPAEGHPGSPASASPDS